MPELAISGGVRCHLADDNVARSLSQSLSLFTKYTDRSLSLGVAKFVRPQVVRHTLPPFRFAVERRPAGGPKQSEYRRLSRGGDSRRYTGKGSSLRRRGSKARVPAARGLDHRCSKSRPVTLGLNNSRFRHALQRVARSAPTSD